MSIRNNEERIGAVDKNSGSDLAPIQAAQQLLNPLNFVTPTLMVDLPSKGEFYPEDHPLHKQEMLEIKHMTAKEEDILTSQNLIQQGVVIDKLLESVIATPEVNLNDMLIGDKNALMLGTRILGYGKNYEVIITDPDSREKVEYSVDLTTLEHKKIDESIFENGNNFEYELPNSKRVLQFKLLTQGDEKEINAILKGYEKIQDLTGVSMGLTTRLKYQIQSIDGESDQKKIDNFVDNEFLALDTRAFRKHIDSITPDIELKFDYTSQAGNLHKIDVPLGIEFFWPAAE